MEQKDYESVIVGLIGGNEDAAKEAYRKLLEWETIEHHKHFAILTQNGQYVQIPCTRPDGYTEFCASTEVDKDYIDFLLPRDIHVDDIECSDAMVAHIRFDITVKYRLKNKTNGTEPNRDPDFTQGQSVSGR